VATTLDVTATGATALSAIETVYVLDGWNAGSKKLKHLAEVTVLLVVVNGEYPPLWIIVIVLERTG
jgi:hypothetical protein